MIDIYKKLGTCHPKLSRGRVWCTTCGRSQGVNTSNRMQHGWPKCCGYTMTIDSPEERGLNCYGPRSKPLKSD